MYIEEETTLMIDPLFSREALSELIAVKERPARRNKVKGFLTVSGVFHPAANFRKKATILSIVQQQS